MITNNSHLAGVVAFVSRLKACDCRSPFTITPPETLRMMYFMQMFAGNVSNKSPPLAGTELDHTGQCPALTPQHPPQTGQ